jgi:hypothetical protein
MRRVRARPVPLADPRIVVEIATAQQHVSPARHHRTTRVRGVARASQLLCTAWMKHLLFAAVLLTSSIAAADPREDFAFEVKESTGDYNRAWVITKMTTFKVGAKCWEQMQDKDKFGAVQSAGFYTRDVVAYAKLLTKDDWDAIESQNNNDRETNKKLIEPMMDEFAKRFSMTISVEGDACEPKRNALWLKYWTEIGEELKKSPPKAAKVTIDLQVKAKVKDISITVDKTGGRFTIVAPRDIEVVNWSGKIEKAFAKVARPL